MDSKGGIVFISKGKPVDHIRSNTCRRDSSITHFVEQFIAEKHCKGALNDITIDEILPDSTIITVRTMTAHRRYFTQHPKRRKVVVKGAPFYYYDGSEEGR